MGKKNETPVLQMKGISKTFGTNQVLHQVNFDLYPGEVHALLGENGAGKSTLLNILTGTFKSDEGEIHLHGTKINLKNMLVARNSGIVRVHQELQVIPEMTVGQNIFLGREPVTKLGMIDYKAIHANSKVILERLNADFSSETMIGNLSVAQMQMVEISKALLQDFSVLALDEPTSSLTHNEIEKLMLTIEQLRNDGKSVIYISHRMEEIFRIADRATVLRDGHWMGVVNIKDVSQQDLIRMMVGRDIKDQHFNETYVGTDEIVLETRNLTGKGFRNANFFLRRGEVLGFSGLIGAGRTELARALFGIDPATSGEIILYGEPRKILNPAEAKRCGIMLIPEDRKRQGIIGTLSNKTNISLSKLSKYESFGVIKHASILSDAKEWIRRFHVSPADPEMQTKSLSGGNQQKIVFIRNLNVDPKILILDEPTRGIDINIKFEIYKLIRQLANDGKSIILISSELPEIISISDRVIVMCEGEINGELKKSEISEESIMTYAMGGL